MTEANNNFTVPDICDDFSEDVIVGELFLNSYGGVDKFCGEIRTAECPHSNSIVKEMVQENGDGKILFIYRNDQWDLPKGRIEKKELIIDGALREVIEETGVKDLIVKKPLPTTFHLFKRNGSYKLKKTYWFLMTTSFEGKLTPQVEEGINQAVWKSKEAIPELMKNAYENIKILVKEIL